MVIINKKGFTLIELLVVVAIIGLLATLSTVALNKSREKARDVRRLDDVRTIITALEMYSIYNGYYPEIFSASSCCWQYNGWKALEEELLPYISKLPADPKNKDPFYYAYNYNPFNGASIYFRLENENPNVSQMFSGKGSLGNVYYFTYFTRLGPYVFR